jgi:hypothetical protein
MRFRLSLFCLPGAAGSAMGHRAERRACRKPAERAALNSNSGGSSLAYASRGR